MEVKYVVIIVTYNRLHLLRECIAQIENQTIKAQSVIIVDNASTDGTAQYLKELLQSRSHYKVISCFQNIGGAGGFEKGFEAAVREPVDCVLVLDDDAMIEASYMQKIITARLQHNDYQAFAGAVETDGRVDTFHRRNIVRPGLLLKNCPVKLYTDKNTDGYFTCDIASFCGMVLDKELIQKIGMPCREYFIWFDDTEYSLRISQFTKFLVVPDARLNHKTKAYVSKYPHRRYDWREYYGIRNRILCVRKHGNAIDRVVNSIDMFCNIILRNWVFGALKVDGYDWEYEKELVCKACRDAWEGKL